jgi:hypothetical protein
MSRVSDFLSPPRLIPALLLSLVVCLWQLSFFLAVPPLSTRFGADPELARRNLNMWDLVWDESNQDQTALWGFDREYREGTALGLCADVRSFFLFFYYLDQLPVGAIGVGAQPHPFTDAATRQLIRQSGSLFRNDFSRPCNTARYGDLGKVFLFWAAAILSGNPFPPSVVPATALVFVAGLCAVLIGFWRAGYATLGLLIVVFVGSNPFQIFEVYARENVFSLPISSALLVLGAHVRLMTDGRRIDRWAWPTAALTGVFLASVREIRTDSALLALAVPGIYLTVRGSPWRRRLALVAVFAACGLLTARAWQGYFETKYAEAQDFVRIAGGQPYTGPRAQHHPVWHNVFTGLGDFDTDKGYRWDDRIAYAYAAPILHSRYHLNYTYPKGGFYFEESYDQTRENLVSPQDLPEYVEIIREKVIGDVLGDPGWYLGILGRRLLAIMSQTTPIGVWIGPWWVKAPFSGWLVVPTLIGVVVARRAFLAKLLLFSFPLSLSALLVFCGPGSTYYAIFHILTLCVWIQLLIEAVKSRAARSPVR